MDSSPPPSLATLPLELLSNIITYLPFKRHIFSLLLTCKRLYHATYPRLWQSLESNPKERYSYTTNAKNRKTGLRRLGDIAKEIGTDVLGFKYLKYILFWPADLEADSAWVESGLLAVISGQIVARRIQLRCVEFVLDTEVNGEALEFLKVLKEHSKDWPQKLRIRINVPWSKELLPLITENFRLEDITYLRLRYDEDEPSGGTGQGVEITIDNIKRLTNLLQKLPFLEDLEINGPEHPDEIFETPIQPLLPALYQLQNAISELKKLHKLYTSDLLFHPSFFITPPENVKKLVIAQGTSAEWWRKFSRCSFTKLEELTIHVGRVLECSKWASPDDIDVRSGAKDFVFGMGYLELKSLKKLQADSGVGYGLGPEDFFDLVLANNPGLDKESRKHCEFMTQRVKPILNQRRRKRRAPGAYSQ